MVLVIEPKIGFIDPVCRHQIHGHQVARKGKEAISSKAEMKGEQAANGKKVRTSLWFSNGVF